MQPYEVYQQLKSQGYFFSDPNKSRLLEYEEFDKAYQWMIEQMKLKIGMPPKGVKTPIWAWYKRNYKHKRPDFRWVRDFDDEVCIEFEIPDDEVLLSDFMAWHFVLGDFCYSQIDDEKESKRFDDWFDSLPISEQKKLRKNLGK